MFGWINDLWNWSPYVSIGLGVLIVLIVGTTVWEAIEDRTDDAASEYVSDMTYADQWAQAQARRAEEIRFAAELRTVELRLELADMRRNGRAI